MSKKRRGGGKRGKPEGVWRERSADAQDALIRRSTPPGGARASGAGRSPRARGVKRWQWVLLVVAVLVAIGWAVLHFVFPGLLGAATLPAAREQVAVNTVNRADFVGAERCASCHAAEYAVWKESTHGRAGGAPSREQVIAAFDGTPIQFADGVVTPRMNGDAYEFVVAENGEPPRILRVAGVIGRGHLEGGGTQGFFTLVGDGTARFLPFDWSRQGHAWFCNTNSRATVGWTPITPRLRLADCGDWPPVRVLGDLPRYANCQSCHASQLTVSLDTVRHQWDTRYTSLAINCESCHGPGRRHVELAGSGAIARGADIGYAALVTLGKDASLAVCYQCHAVKDQLREGFLSGDSLEAFYSLKSPLLGDRPLHPDGRVRTFAYQEAHQYSDCYLNGGMTCTTCHDSHSQRYRDVVGAALAGRFDDRQCTSCHASKAGRETAHSHHAASSPGSRCTACHMPYRQLPETRAAEGRESKVAGVRYARADHGIAIPRPLADSTLGVPGACAACHATRSAGELEGQVRAWWGELKPVKPVVAAQLRFRPPMPASEAGPLLLGSRGDSAGDAHAFARYAGVARFLETYARPDDAAFGQDAGRRLEELSENPDADVRAAALATLHLVRGAEPSTRRVLATALTRAGAHDAGLRARWSLTLGFMGDRFADAGDLASAVSAYRRALEVTPGNPRVLLGLANAQRDAGDPRAAIATYRLGLAQDAMQPLALVNLGIALAAVGDTVSAFDALTRAATLNPGEPLAWFNLGNISLVRGQLDQAAEAFGKAAALDPGIAVTHFRLARVWLLRRDLPAALRELRRGLKFDSTDVAAREAADGLAKSLGRVVK